MSLTKDLNIEKDIIPLFDFTFNDFARKELFNIFNEPALSAEEAISRQSIIKALLKNQNHLESYSYSRADFNEVHAFTGRFYLMKSIILEKKYHLRLRLAFSKKGKSRAYAQFAQFILLLFHLNNRYFSYINKHDFPKDFQAKIENMHQLLSCLPLSKYEAQIRNGQFGMNAIVSLISSIRKNITEDKLKRFWSSFFIFEAWLSITKGMAIQGFAFPKFNENTFQIKGVYHPGINKPVKNDLIASRNVILITGPNMSGKSTLLKSVALCVYFSRLGLGVPASECTLPFFDYLSVAINLHDDLTKGMSHFLSEIKQLKEVVLKAEEGNRCFAVFDEIFRGTTVEDALAISKITINGLSKFTNSYFFISTHLHALKQNLNMNLLNIHYMDCHIHGESIDFSYQRKEGWSDLKIGQILFEKEGLNKLLKI